MDTLFHSERLDRLEKKVDRVLSILQSLFLKESTMTVDIQTILAEASSGLEKIKANTNTLSAVTDALGLLHSQVSTLQGELAVAVHNEDSDTVTAVSDKLKALLDATDIQATAIAALTNTPAAAPPQPTVAQQAGSGPALTAGPSSDPATAASSPQ